MGKETTKQKKKIKWWHIAIVVVAILMLSSGGEDADSESTPTNEQVTMTPSTTAAPTLTATPVPTPTVTPAPTATSTPKPTATPALAQIIGNANTNKYHTTDCGKLPAEENRIYFDSVEEAETAGMVECGYCEKKRK